MRFIFKIIIHIFLTYPLVAQNTRDIKAEDTPDFFNFKPLRFGIAWLNGWSSLVGSNLPADYFYKPSVGLKFQLDYFFNKNWGINAAIAYQQRGAGIYTPDFIKAVGDPDSTHRYRLRLNSFELPILLIYRQDKPIIGGTRFTAGLGAVPAFIAKAGTIFHSVEDGFHINENVSSQYRRFDMLAQLQFGLDINAADACLLQVQLYYQQGFINAYRSSFSPATGLNSNFGIKLAFMY